MVLSYVGVGASGITNVFNASRSRRPSAADPIDRIRLVGLESDLRRSLQETERAAESLYGELRDMALDSCATDQPTVPLALGYTNALPAATMLLDLRVSRSAEIARSCAEHPGFDQESRERLGKLASHLDSVGRVWRERRWLIERSHRNALEFLVFSDRPRGPVLPAPETPESSATASAVPHPEQSVTP
jgi:hypothetical protein